VETLVFGFRPVVEEGLALETGDVLDTEREERFDDFIPRLREVFDTFLGTFSDQIINWGTRQLTKTKSIISPFEA